MPLSLPHNGTLFRTLEKRHSGLYVRLSLCWRSPVVPSTLLRMEHCVRVDHLQNGTDQLLARFWRYLGGA